MIVTCPWCGYEWNTRSRMRQITCPDCHGKFPQPAPAVRLLNDIEPCDLCGHEGLEYHVCRIDGDAAIVCSACLGKIANGEVK